MLIPIVYYMFIWCQAYIIQHMSAQAMLFQVDAKTSYCPSVQFLCMRVSVCVVLYGYQMV